MKFTKILLIAGLALMAAACSRVGGTILSLKE